MNNTFLPGGSPIDLYGSKLTQPASSVHPGVYEAPQGYDVAQMWGDFNYHRGDHNGDYFKYTGSAAAATAMYTGQKTYRGAISMDLDGNELKTIAEIAADRDKATGSVSSVQLNHATPGCVDAHTYYRKNKHEIAYGMAESDLDVIMGGDNYIDGTDYSDPAYGDGVAGFKAHVADKGFTVIDDSTLSDWTDLADGTFNGGAIPQKVAGVFTGSTTAGRSVPTLNDMTKGALNVLEQDEDGFFLMVEGGAVDWENHANSANTMMREQVDFDNSVQTVLDWIADNGGWSDNLLIITADHETGGIWGPGTITNPGDSNGQYDVGEPYNDANGNGQWDDGEDYQDVGTVFDHTDDTFNGFQKITDAGPGVVPDWQYTTRGHTNVLVPLWAAGVGSEQFAGLVRGTDADADAFWTEAQGWDWDGSYVDNTDVFTVMDTVIPEPATISLLAIGAVAIIRRRRA